MNNLIVSTRADRVNVSWEHDSEPHVQVHFNCLDEDGRNLTGLGGTYFSNRHASTAAQKAADRVLLRFIVDKATELVQLYDEWIEPGEPVQMQYVFIARYGPTPADGQGISMRYLRPGFVFESAILFESHPTGQEGALTMRYNQKHDVTDPEAIRRINALICTVFDAVESQIHPINQQRQIKQRRLGTWHS